MLRRVRRELGRARGSAVMAPILAAGALDRLEEARFRARHRARPGTGGLAADPAGALERAVRGGIAYLERTQRASGLWRGFMLAPGASTEWVSAHVAFVLEEVAETHAMRQRAARALLANGRRRGGWGYNERIRVDSDSTAQAIMVLARLEHEVAPEWAQRLLATRHEEGGFATYASEREDGRARSWWEMPHGDVTLIVVEALRRLEIRERERRQAIEWLSAAALDGVVPAYWWTSPAYSLWAQVRAGFAPAASSAAAVALLDAERRAVYLAMLIAAALAGDGSPAQLPRAISRLLRAQLQDGSWPCAPCLRNTRADSPGGYEAPGPVYADRYRAFSTAHAVAALSLALERQRPSSSPSSPSASRKSRTSRSAC